MPAPRYPWRRRCTRALLSAATATAIPCKRLLDCILTAAARIHGVPQVFVNTGGVPNGVAFDPNGVVYICDFAHQAVLTLGAAEDGSDQQLTAIVKDYEGKNLKVRAPLPVPPRLAARHRASRPLIFSPERPWSDPPLAAAGPKQRGSGQQGYGVLH